MRSRIAGDASRLLPGFRIGHASNYRDLTGCTVILCERGAVCGVDVRGSAAGTRELASCLPGHLTERVHAVFLAGGSAFGLDAAAGVMQFLESKRVGFRTGRVHVPIVPAAVIFDLAVGSTRARPDVAMAKRACWSATTKIVEGSVGAGTGATVGKLFGIGQATKGGVGFHSMSLQGGVLTQTLAVVNAFGDVTDPRTGGIIAGARAARNSSTFARTTDQMFRGKSRKEFGTANTTLAVVMTDALLTKLEATKVAQMAQDGLARAINPVHTQFDGDLVFALSLGRKKADLNTLGAAAAETTANAIVRAVLTARGLGGVPSCRELAKRE